ncbi:2-Methylisocitrate lyase, PEP mutase family [Rhizobiales bacterium GAS113]|jgi:2-methylisocitrate lyase-like PEP mutase family enzyme|nr:2-Methylisocitrate lyase, PEP mutase family [Rhizobiales bacterium GAS113]
MTLDRTFRSLHDGPDILLLANAWDAGSARLIESRGAKAIATTSAGLAWSRGYPDGDVLPREHHLDAIREIARVIRVPLTVDIESGYSDDPATVGQVVASVIDAGAVGINIEDGGGSPELLCAKIEAARRSAASAGIDLFINARTDVYLRGLAAGDAAAEEVMRRARLYRSAGCDCLFVPILADGPTIAAVASAIAPLPLNIMLVPGLPANDQLRAHGVRRLSAGSAIAQAVLARTSKLTDDFLSGKADEMFVATAEYGATNKLFPRA